MSILIGIICFMIWLIANPRIIISITYELGDIYSILKVDWDHYTNPFYMKLKIPIDMKISNVEKKWGKALDVTYVDDGGESPIYI